MIARLTSYLNFNGNARQAVEFYHSVFGGEVQMNTYADFAGDMPMDDSEKDKIMHAQIKNDSGVELMLSDVPSGTEFQQGSQITLSLSGDDEAKLRGYWEKLAQDGTITMPLELAPWGDTFGTLTDKFGINWMVDIGTLEQ